MHHHDHHHHHQHWHSSHHHDHHYSDHFEQVTRCLPPFQGLEVCLFSDAEVNTNCRLLCYTMYIVILLSIPVILMLIIILVTRKVGPNGNLGASVVFLVWCRLVAFRWSLGGLLHQTLMMVLLKNLKMTKWGQVCVGPVPGAFVHPSNLPGF